MKRHRFIPIFSIMVLGALPGGCSLDLFGGGKVTGASAPPVLAARQFSQPVLTPDGVCEGETGSGSVRGAEVALGIGECDLLRAKGKPTDVLIGESGKGQRETQVLYSEPTGREIYLFTDNKLTRIIKPGQG